MAPFRATFPVAFTIACVFALACGEEVVSGPVLNSASPEVISCKAGFDMKLTWPPLKVVPYNPGRHKLPRSIFAVRTVPDNVSASQLN